MNTKSGTTRICSMCAVVSTLFSPISMPVAVTASSAGLALWSASIVGRGFTIDAMARQVQDAPVALVERDLDLLGTATEQRGRRVEAAVA